MSILVQTFWQLLSWMWKSKHVG